MLGLDDLNLHDSDLLRLTMIRARGHDRVELLLSYVEDYSTGERRERVLEFIDCFLVRLAANGGVASPDAILDATELIASPLIDEAAANWHGLGMATEELRHFSIEFSTTGSKLEILAKQLRLS